MPRIHMCAQTYQYTYISKYKYLNEYISIYLLMQGVGGVYTHKHMGPD